MSPDRGEGPSGPGLWVGLALGTPVMAYGFRGVLVDDRLTHPAEWARWVVLSAIAHDLLLVPVVLVIGWLLARAVPERAWPAVRWGLFTSGVLLLTFWPYVRGYGRNATIPSLLDRNYAAGLIGFLAATWLVVAVIIVARYRSAARSRRAGGTAPAPAGT